jgi:hypothetical protein
VLCSLVSTIFVGGTSKEASHTPIWEWVNLTATRCKLFNADAAAIAPLYERMPDFIRLIERLDPRGAFCNSWLKAHVLG